MKKLFFSVLFLFSVCIAQAQVRFGFKTAPNISFNRINAETDNTEFSTDGAGLRFQLGPIFDFEFKENHYFSTGLIFTSKRSAFIADSTGATPERYNEHYNPQYLQIPLTLKLYTEEIGLDKKIYFQFGGTVDFRTNNPGDEEKIVKSFKFMDLNSLLAIGLEYGIGIKTKVFGGLIYQRGLLNVINENIYNDNFNLRNDFIGLELGLTF